MVQHANGAPRAEHMGEPVSERGPTLLAVHRPTRYTEAEQRFSATLQKRLDELLSGERNTLMLLRKYPDEPNRVGVMANVAVDPSQLRISGDAGGQLQCPVRADGGGGGKFQL